MPNKDTLLNFLKNIYPGCQIDFVGGCWSSVAFVVSDTVIRFPKNGMAPYEKEAKLLPFIKSKITYQIPEVKINQKSEFPFAYHQMIKGNKWTLAGLSDVDAEKIKKLAGDCALFFSQIHRIPVSEIRQIIPDIKSHHQPRVIPKDELWNISSPYLSAQAFDKIYSAYSQAAAYRTTDLVFSHGDFSGSNSLIDQEYNLIGVFDWASAGIEEREYEFIRFCGDDDVFLKLVIHHYEELTGIKININRVKEISLLDLINIFYAVHTREYLFSTRESRMPWLLESLYRFC